jgi:hypothetical protein
VAHVPTAWPSRQEGYCERRPQAVSESKVHLALFWREAARCQGNPCAGQCQHDAALDSVRICPDEPRLAKVQ